MKRTKVVCVGEALIDRIKNKSNKKFKDFFGGAPANVACALRKLKIDTAFIGCLGTDKFGKKFIKTLDELNVNLDFLQLHTDLPTRVVKVDRDQFGDRYFSGFDTSFHKVFADQALSIDFLKKDIENLEKLFLETKYLVTGTILLSSSLSSESLNFLIGAATKFDVKIVIDLNWRKVFWDYSTFTSRVNDKERIDLIKKFLNYAHILKLAKEEAILFFEEQNPLKISKTISTCPDVIVTDGGNPISWFINGIEGRTEVINSCKIVDTTGGGDAFLAGLISKLISLDYPLKELEIKDIINYASICGLLTCLGEGAIEQQPDYAKVNDFLGSEIL